VLCNVVKGRFNVVLSRSPHFDAALVHAKRIDRYPVLFIDEYQDTNDEFMGALAAYFLEPKKGPLTGLFGDHWQTIYRDDFDLAERTAFRQASGRG